MRPHPWRIITGATARPQTKTPFRLTEMTASNASSSIRPANSPSLSFTSWASRRMPALFTRMSIRPRSASAAATAVSTARASVTSTRRSAPSTRSHVSTVAPASRKTRAVSAPMPRAPPVITATRPCRVVMPAMVARWNAACTAARYRAGQARDNPPLYRLGTPRIPHCRGDHAAHRAHRGALRHARRSRRPPESSAPYPPAWRPRHRGRVRAHDLRVLAHRPRRGATVPHPRRGAVAALHADGVRRAPGDDARIRRRRARPAGAVAVPGTPRGRGDHRRGWHPYRVPQRPARGRHDRDRKSTRLNSSHGSISYAVFCLKKKKTKKLAWMFSERMSNFKYISVLRYVG